MEVATELVVRCSSGWNRRVMDGWTGVDCPSSSAEPAHAPRRSRFDGWKANRALLRRRTVLYRRNDYRAVTGALKMTRRVQGEKNRLQALTKQEENELETPRNDTAAQPLGNAAAQHAAAEVQHSATQASSSRTRSTRCHKDKATHAITPSQQSTVAQVGAQPKHNTGSYFRIVTWFAFFTAPSTIL